MKTTKGRELLVFLRAMVLSCFQNNFLFKAVHLQGVQNTKADALSRLQVTKFTSPTKAMAPEPTAVPPQPLTQLKHNHF